MGKILVNLCLSDLPKKYIKEVTISNGEKKKFINIVVSERSEPDQKGNDYTIYAYKPKEYAQDSTTFVGKGKTMMPREASDVASPAPKGNDDLPF